MSIKGKIKTLFSDKNKTEVLFPRTKVSAVSDDNGVGLNVLLEQTVPMTRGGTGAENGAEGLANMFAAGSTVLSPYQYGTELPSNAAVGQVYFEEATGTIADIGQDVAKAVRAVNLLDNSDFRNPVNQRGQTTYQFDSGYTIDRWKLHWTGDGSLTVNDGYITLTRPAHTIYLFQNIPLEKNLIGKTVTVAAKVRGKGTVGFYFNNEDRSNVDVDSDVWTTVVFTRIVPTYDFSSYSLNGVEIKTTYGTTLDVEWAALYEGEYTVETLPPYVPKGYGAELTECLRYLRTIVKGESDTGIYLKRCGLADWGFDMQYSMRIAPSLLIIGQPRAVCTNTSGAVGVVSSPTISIGGSAPNNQLILSSGHSTDLMAVEIDFFGQGHTCGLFLSAEL